MIDWLIGLPVAPLVWENIRQTAEKLSIPNLDRFQNAMGLYNSDQLFISLMKKIEILEVVSHR